MNNAVFGKDMENVRKHRNTKLVRIEKRNYLVSEPNYYKGEFSSENLLDIEQLQIFVNKPVLIR